MNKNLPAALGWLGLTLVLLPVALICLFIMVALVVASPVAGIIFGVIVFACARAMFTRRR